MPTFGEVLPKLCHGPNLAKLGPFLNRIWSMLAMCFARVCPSVADLDQSQPHVGRSDRSSAGLGQSRSMLLKIKPKLAKAGRSNQMWANFGP